MRLGCDDVAGDRTGFWPRCAGRTPALRVVRAVRTIVRDAQRASRADDPMPSAENRCPWLVCSGHRPARDIPFNYRPHATAYDARSMNLWLQVALDRRKGRRHTPRTQVRRPEAPGYEGPRMRHQKRRRQHAQGASCRARPRRPLVPHPVPWPEFTAKDDRITPRCPAGTRPSGSYGIRRSGGPGGRPEPPAPAFGPRLRTGSPTSDGVSGSGSGPLLRAGSPPPDRGSARPAWGPPVPGPSGGP